MLLMLWRMSSRCVVMCCCVAALLWLVDVADVDVDVEAEAVARLLTMLMKALC